MKRLVRSLIELAHDNGFTAFQNEIARAFYRALQQGYSADDDETGLVDRLVDSVDGKAFGPVSLHGFTLRGPGAPVEFGYRARTVQRELGDLALVALATRGKRRLFQRVTLTQTIKSDGETWNLDREHLFLLKNFPTFTGHGREDVTFRNKAGSLGSVALVSSPGEMIFSKARLVSEFARGTGSVSSGDIAVPRVAVQGSDTSGPVPMFWIDPRLQPTQWEVMLEEYFNRFGPELTPFLKSIEFMGNVHYARDIYDLVRSWTRLSIGEPSCINDTVVNDAVDAFTNCLLRSGGLGDLVELPTDDLFCNQTFHGSMGVLVVHLQTDDND